VTSWISRSRGGSTRLRANAITPTGSPSRISGTPIIERTPPTLASPFFFVQWVRPGIVDMRNFPAQSCTTHWCSLPRKNWRLLLDFSIDWLEIDTYRPAIYPVVQSEDASRVHPAEPSSSLDKALQRRSQLELMTPSTSEVAACCSSNSSLSRLRRATFVSKSAEEGLRGRTAFGATRLLRVAVF